MIHPRAKIAAALRKSDSILLVNHVGPDGDTLGSTLALALALEGMGKRVTVASEDKVPSSFAFLPGADRIVSDLPPDRAFDVTVTMECSTLDRCGRFADAVLRTPLIITIDHHESHTPYGHLDYWDPTAAAVGEMTADLVRELGVGLTPPIACALLTAVATDTGVFRFATVRPRTLRLAADLIEAGARLSDIVTHVYEQRTPAANRLLGYALLRMVVTADGALAFSTLSEAVRRAAGALPEDGSGIVGVLRAMRGVKVAILFTESPEGIEVSIRTRDGVRANAIAEPLGGGGHAGAAGCTLPGPMDEAVARVLTAVEAELPTSDSSLAGPAMDDVTV